ncbi:hypothetical protein ROHU_018232 [Labeo rohita]|uniref:Uncharacterized protein n=1 Tax=Labeo rohita TaxID=84645 RepID=A0A498NDW7_LABRO|nr:hypothetical protein ROHU_018232 [Labeo rohita]
MRGASGNSLSEPKDERNGQIARDAQYKPTSDHERGGSLLLEGNDPYVRSSVRFLTLFRRHSQHSARLQLLLRV